MNRKGKLTTKGKHAVILTLTIVACVAAMLFSLLLSVLCDGKHVSSAAHTQNDTHPGIMAGSQRQETDLLTPQWLYYQSNGSVCNLLEYLTQRDIQTKNSGVNVRYRGKHRFFKGFNEFIKEKTRRCDNDFEKIERHVFF